MRFYKLTAVDGGPLPEHDWLKVGAIIRVPRSNSRKPGAVYNAETESWAIPTWTEINDPRGGAA